MTTTSGVRLHASGPAAPRRRWWTAVTLAALAVSGCGKEVVVVAPPQKLEVSTVRAKAEDTPITSDFVAKTASSRRVEIRSRVEGFLEKRLYLEGTMVNAGDPLFEIDKKPFQARLDIARAQQAQQEARMETARRNLERIRPLAAKRAVAQRELDEAEGMYRDAAAAVEGAKAEVVQAELNLGYTDITSPLKGLTSYATRREGAYIGMFETEPLTYVAQLDPMWVEFSLSENQILRQRADEAAGKVRHPKDKQFEVEIILADGTSYPHRGRIAFSDASLSEATGTFLIRAEIPNEEENLRPGQFVTVRVHGAIRPNAILVPQSAVQQGAKTSFVWVLDAQNRTEQRPVTVGPFRGDDWFIDKGLEDGDTVVVGGAQKLSAGIEVKSVPYSAEAAAR